MPALPDEPPVFGTLFARLRNSMWLLCRVVQTDYERYRALSRKKPYER